MLKRLLIANRGEIACRIIRTAQRLGIHCIAVYSDADQNSLACELADEAHCIGPAPSQNSYLDSEKILAVAQATQADAIHPGYGFLSENADFAERCSQANIIFVGPPVEAIRVMGDKRLAKDSLLDADIPLLPGYHGAAQDDETLEKAAEKMGFPLIIKPSAGGGGKGMRVVENAETLKKNLAAARREAKSSFGDSTLLLERYLENPRHIEVQIFSDQQHNTVHLFTRDCSLQRRQQKVIEEAPGIAPNSALSQAITRCACRIAETIQYVGAGTVEFLLDHDDQFYFMEMNTRLQVEHPVTEMITGFDLVEWQLLIAQGHPLPVEQKNIRATGHSMEARIYAEDPFQNFLPSIGLLKTIQWPEENTHCRIDTGVRAGDRITPYYDPMIAKLIVHGNDRNDCQEKFQTALSTLYLSGIEHNTALLSMISKHPDFIAHRLTTHWLGNTLKNLLEPQEASPLSLCLAATYYLLCDQKDTKKPWQTTNSWQLNGAAQHQLRLRNNKKTTVLTIHPQEKNHWSLQFRSQDFTVSGRLGHHNDRVYLEDCVIKKNGETPVKFSGVQCIEDEGLLHLLFESNHIVLQRDDAQNASKNQNGHQGQLVAPMPATVTAICIDINDNVQAGAPLLILEAMKMEHTVQAPTAGCVTAIHYQVGDSVKEGSELLSFSEEGS